MGTLAERTTSRAVALESQNRLLFAVGFEVRLSPPLAMDPFPSKEPIDSIGIEKFPTQRKSPLPPIYTTLSLIPKRQHVISFSNGPNFRRDAVESWRNHGSSGHDNDCVGLDGVPQR